MNPVLLFVANHYDALWRGALTILGLGLVLLVIALVRHVRAR